MKYNAVLDVYLSGGTSVNGSYTLATESEVSTAAQSVFALDGVIAGKPVLLVFIDGVKWEPVSALVDITEEKTYYFDGTDIAILNGLEAGVTVSALYVSTGTATAQDEPVTVAEFKDWARVDLADDDDIIEMLITAAREELEAYTNISFIRRTVTANILNGLGGQLLPYGPVVDIVYLKDHEDTAIDADDYTIAGVNFKRLETEYCEPVTIQYTAGYASLPKDFKTALLCQVAYMYENRGDNKTDGICKEALLKLKRHRRL